MTKANAANDTLTTEVLARLKIAIDANDEIPHGYGRASAIAKLLGETPQTVRLWLSDGKERKAGLPEISKILNLTKRLNISVGWLLEGTGKMGVNTKNEVPPADPAMLASTWQFVSGELSSVIDLDRLTHKSLGDILEHVYEAVSDYKQGIPDALLPFIRKTVRKQVKEKIKVIN